MTDLQLLERTKTALKCLFTAVLILATAQFVSAGGWSRVNTVQAVHYSMIIAGWLALRGTPSRARIFGITLFELMVVAIAAVCVGALNADMPRATVTLIGAMLGGAILMPWGARWQSIAAGSAAASAFLGAAVSDRLEMTPRDGAMLVVMLLASVFIAHVLDRQRRHLEREQAQRQKDQEALRLSEALFRTIFESAAIGMVRIDATGAIVEVNDAMCRTVANKPEALVGTQFRALLEGGEGHDDDGLFEDLIAGRCRSYQADCQFRHREGQVVWGHTTISSIESAGVGMTLVAIVDDITVRKHAEEQLAEAKEAAEAAAEAKGRFLAIMSHEIRTPLNAVLGFNELLAGTELDETQMHFVDTVGQSGRHLNDIVNDVLDFSKIESGALELECAPIDVTDEVRAAVRMFEGAARKKGVSLVCDVSDRFPSNVLGDGKRIRQIASNLVSNAIKFTKNGTVSVRLVVGTTTPDRSVVELEVADTGTGIDAESCGHLFEPFVQADNSTTRNYGGTGLGLAICKQLVDLMGGNIQVQSTLGEGSRFRVVLPLERTNDTTGERPVISRAMRSARETLRGLRVLVVEDDPTNAALMDRLLSRVGCVVERARDGSEALVALARHNHPIVMMDIDMPVMDGREATHRIRTQFARDAQPYIIAVTAHVMPGDRELYLRAGMNDYVSKPIHAEELGKALERAIDDSTSGVARAFEDADR